MVYKSGFMEWLYTSCEVFIVLRENFFVQLALKTSTGLKAESACSGHSWRGAAVSSLNIGKKVKEKRRPVLPELFMKTRSLLTPPQATSFTRW